MEDQTKGANVRKEDEDVEGHAHKNAPSQHKLASDEGDDVEAHAHKNAPEMHKLANDEDDDVEAHMHKNQVNLGMHKN